MGGICTRGLLALWAGAILVGLTGCGGIETDWSYRNIALGQPPAQYLDKLPAETSRRTALGLCSFTSKGGQARAVVVLVTPDRRVAAKLRATLGGRWPAGGYRLEGELDPRLLDTAGAGPLDTLRVLIAELTGYRGERLALDAHGLVAAGLLRMVERWPQVAPAGRRSEVLRHWLERVPAGGRAELGLTPGGVFTFGYEAR